jgi:hypothetical protein
MWVYLLPQRFATFPKALPEGSHADKGRARCEAMGRGVATALFSDFQALRQATYREHLQNDKDRCKVFPPPLPSLRSSSREKLRMGFPGATEVKHALAGKGDKVSRATSFNHF